MSLVASKAFSLLLGGFLTFAGVSKTSGFQGIATSLSDEMQAGFRNGTWGAIFGGLPNLPFLYAVGTTEVVTGSLLLGYTVGMVPPVVAQWCAAVLTFIQRNATSAHVVQGDPLDKQAFCGIVCLLFATLNFCIAHSRGGKWKSE